MSTAQTSLGIAFLIAGMLFITVNDSAVKLLSDGYPLHQIVFARSAIGIGFSLIILRLEGGLPMLRTRRPALHALRGLMIVIANMCFFAALAVLPQAEATALFFVAPLFITLLSVPILGETIGPVRLTAVLIGFAGVLVMQRPWAASATLEVSRWVLVLPVIAALTYAMTQILTRKLGVDSKASAMAIYIQVSFLAVSVLFYALAGDGRFEAAFDNPAMAFLLRAWVWPDGPDWWILIGLGVLSAGISYCMGQAYRLADAGTIAPYEYIGLPFAVLFGWLVFSDLPEWEVWVGIVLILGSGLFVFLRERRKAVLRPNSRAARR